MKRNNSEIVSEICELINYHDKKLESTFFKCEGCEVCDKILELGIEGSGGKGRQNRSTKRYFVYNRERKLIDIFETRQTLLKAIGLMGNEKPIELENVTYNGMIIRTSDEYSNVYQVAMRNIKYYKYKNDLHWSDLPGNNQGKRKDLGYLPTVRVMREMAKIFGLPSHLVLYEGLEFEWKHEPNPLEFERRKR